MEKQEIWRERERERQRKGGTARESKTHNVSKSRERVKETGKDR